MHKIERERFPERMEDETILCSSCSSPFLFSLRKQVDFAKRGFARPLRCKSCIDAKKVQAASSSSASASAAVRNRAPWETTDLNKDALISNPGIKTAGFLIGPKRNLLPVLSNFSERNQTAKDDCLSYACAIPLRHITRFFVHGSDYKQEFNSAFAVKADDAPFYRGRNGLIEELTSVLPSNVTSKQIAGNRSIYEEILSELRSRHPDWYILGVQYSDSDPSKCDIQPFITESRDSRNGATKETPANTIFRGFQEELQISLSGAKKAFLADNMGPAIAYSISNTTRRKEKKNVTRVLHNVVVHLNNGVGVDYSFISTPAAQKDEFGEFVAEEALPVAEVETMTHDLEEKLKEIQLLRRLTLEDGGTLDDQLTTSVTTSATSKVVSSAEDAPAKDTPAEDAPAKDTPAEHDADIGDESRLDDNAETPRATLHRFDIAA